MRISVILVLCLLLTSCYGAGIGIVGGKTIVEEKVENLDQAKLLARHGAPTKINKISETEQVFYYYRGLGWTGVWPYVALFFPVPVPLVIPTRTDWDEYHILSGKVLTKSSQSTNTTHCFVGYAPEHEGTMKYHWTSGCGD